MRTLHQLTCTWIGLGTVVFAACAKTDQNASTDTTAMVPAAGATTSTPAPAPPAAAPINLADVAGKWNSRAVPDSGPDTTATASVMTATGTTSGWTIMFPGHGAPIAERVTVGGDSIMVDAGPYPSVRRKGQQVTTHSVMRMRDGKLVGETVAHYAVKTADSVLMLHTVSTRVK
jgi:hypothetical protein